MIKKCDKFETYFTFSPSEDLEKHLNECQDCQNELYEQNRVSQLVREVAPVYLKEEYSFKFKKIVSCCVILIFGLAGIVGFEFSQNLHKDNTLYSQDSYISQMGLPTDDYGLLKI